MQFLKELLNSKSQRELDFDGKNDLDLKASKLHDAFQSSKFNKMFYRKPESWDEVVHYYRSESKHPIKMDDLFGILPPEDIQDLEFTERDVYGGSFNKPLKTFAPKFKQRKLDAFFVITADGVFAVRTEGADYARYVAQVEEEGGEEDRGSK
jgi:hypothetical protein